MSVVAGWICDSFIAPSNPRMSHCSRCSQALDLHPDTAPKPRPRNVELEREITGQATRGLNVDPSALIDHSEARAIAGASEYVSDAMLVRPADHDHETREELADARAYLCWGIEEDPGSDMSHRRLLALRHVALAYDLLAVDA